MAPTDILKKPYARVVMPDSDGSFTAEILEFPGCVATGKTAADALACVEEVGLDWIAAELEQGHDIPEPLDHAQYSGKLVVRMPQGLHKRAAQAAVREGTSLNQYIVTCIAEQTGARARPQFVSVPAMYAVYPGHFLPFGVAPTKLTTGTNKFILPHFSEQTHAAG